MGVADTDGGAPVSDAFYAAHFADADLARTPLLDWNDAPTPNPPDPSRRIETLEAAFSYFDRDPFSSASCMQVGHRRPADGKSVAVGCET